MTLARREFDCEVAVVGAGPYGLGAAAHLKAAHVDVRVFGDPMSFWREHMPRGMNIRSAWHATHLSDPNNRFTLDAYSHQRGFARPDLLSLQDFVAYGEWFQAHAVPDVDTRRVLRVDRENGGFRLDLADGSSMKAGRVVIATGLANQEFVPPEFTGLPREFVSHSADHADLGKFRGQRVAVIGRGQSACESAAILSDEGADVELITRGEVNWLGSSKTASNRDTSPLWRFHDLLSAPSGVGPFPINWLNELPGLERHLPQPARDWLNQRSLRAGATGWLKPRFDGVRIKAGKPIAEVRAAGGRVGIAFQDEVCAYDHVLLATGYHIDISKLAFFAPTFLEAVSRIDGSPRLGSGFESSVPGLHFLGANAVKSYGPVMRFIAGSGFAAKELTRAVFAGRSTFAIARGRSPARTPGLAKHTGAVSR